VFDRHRRGQGESPGCGPPPIFEARERLFVWFSNNRWIEVFVLLVVLFIFGLIVVGVSRRQRFAYA
jgi:hypothetical protein